MRGSLQNTEIQHSSPFLCKYFYKIDIKHLMCSTITTTLTLISDMNDNEFPSKLINLRQLLAAKAAKYSLGISWQLCSQKNLYIIIIKTGF